MRQGALGVRAIYHDARCCGSPATRAVEVTESTHRDRITKSNSSWVGVHSAPHTALRFVLVNEKTARHARDYKAESVLVDGFISGFDSPRLFAREVGLSGRRLC